MTTNRRDIVAGPVAPTDFARRLWNSGQDLLAAGRYVAARRELEAAERQAFFRRDAALLAGIYLPLLEASRQIRQFCCDGIIAITSNGAMERRLALRELARSGGVWLVMEGQRAEKRGVAHQALMAGGAADVPIESLRLFSHHHQWRITAHRNSRFGLPVLWTGDSGRIIQPAQPDNLLAILPPPGVYRPGDACHAQARETLLLTFEALALGWLARQRMANAGWASLAILRHARNIDPACERVLMRMMVMAEALIA